MRLSSIAATLVLSTIGLGLAPEPAAAQGPLSITGINVTDVQIVEGSTDSLLATLDLSGVLRGQGFTLQGVQVPLTLSDTGETSENGCPILLLTLEIEELNLLGLVVELNNCDEEPIEVRLTGYPDEGLLGLGGLLCNLLGPDGLNLSLLIGTDAGSDLELGIQGLLNQIFAALLGQGSSSSPTQVDTDQASPNACGILTLSVGEIDLDLRSLLGLELTTSDICLYVYGEPNEGLLGRLLCSLLNVGSGSAADALASNIIQILRRLGLGL